MPTVPFRRNSFKRRRSTKRPLRPVADLRPVGCGDRHPLLLAMCKFADPADPLFVEPRSVASLRHFYRKFGTQVPFRQCSADRPIQPILKCRLDPFFLFLIASLPHVSSFPQRRESEQGTGILRMEDTNRTQTL